ncbi:hypothetical protein ACH4TQ_27620 [Streptomyces sp. NPDC021218]|uniref:hypothetical protein n=1 Tax=Streptomyces sp. NPDC021218 TaxID=3365119 RepID=UPI00379F39F7
MALDINGILDAVVSHAMASGHFEAVNGHEPKSPPGNGLTAAVWVDDIAPVRSSGLSSASALLVVNVRLYTPMVQEPADAIDPNLMTALDALMRGYVGDFELGGMVRQVDVFGADGPGLRARAGYLRYEDAEYRVITITLPVIVNDLWEEVA